ncbi:MAG: phosphotransferase [Woeseia sp.]
MTISPLKHLLEQIEDQLESTGIRGHIARLEITGEGVVQMELALGERRSWYAWENQALSKLPVATDDKLPLAARLNDASFAARTRLLSYRPGRRLTLIDYSGQKPRILKGFRRGHLDRMVRKYEVAHAALAGRGVHAPEVIEYDTANEALVMVFKAGERLRLSADTTELFYLVGKGLRDFQEHDALADECAFDSRAELQVIDKHAARLQQMGGQLPGHWPGLRKRLAEASAGLAPAVVGLAHRDLHDKQFIQQVNYLALLDFDLMSRADVALDAANFLAHLVLRKLQGLQGASQRGIDAGGKKFLQGLARNEESGFWERLRFYQATTFCRLALVYAVRPKWVGLMPDLVTMGNRCLDDLDRIKET